MRRLADLPQRARLAAVFGVGGSLVLGGALAFGPVVRGRAVAAAAQRGIQLEVRRVGLGWGGVWLKDVDVRAAALPGGKAHLDAVRVGFGWRFDVSSIELHGAQIGLMGDVDELRRQWLTFRAQGTSQHANGAHTSYSADGIDVAWRVRPGLAAQYVWGLRYAREAARESVGADFLRARDAGVDVESRCPRAVLGRSTVPGDEARDAARQLESVDTDALEISVVFAGTDTPTSPPSMGKSRFQPQPALGAQVRAGLAELAALAGRSLQGNATLNLEGVSLHFRRGTETLNFGPSLLRVTRLDEQLDLSLSPKAEGTGTPLELKLSLPMGGGTVRADLRGGPVSLRSLGLREGDFGVANIEGATLKASGDVTLAADGSVVAFAGNGAIERLSLHRPELSASLLTGMNLEFRARGTSTLDAAKLVIDEGELSLGQVRIQGQGQLTRGDGIVQAHWSGGVPLASCQGFLDALPQGLAPLIATLRMSGTFAVRAQLDYDSEHPSDTRVALNVANDCHIEHVPSELAPSRFATLWQREVKGADKQPMELVSGPGSPDWVPYEAISPFMESAVLVCEDGHFPYHRGFDFEAIQNSIRDNLIKGRFVRGGSTITMQLAKNLYLRKEKTLGRKLQEAVLTQLLEQELSKRDLMELYLNVIEYGPGIYGIGPAARYYFDKRPNDLSLGQALYIASILPNPEHQHFGPDGKVSPAWTKYLQHLMHIARKVGYINEEQLAVGLSEQVAFRVADSGASIPANSATDVEEGTDTPSELSP